MKKMIMTMVVVAAVAVVNAATFNWSSSAAGYSVVSENVVGNGSYGVSSVAGDRMFKAGSWTYVLEIYNGEKLVGSANGNVVFNSLNGKFNTQAITVADAAAETTYNYVLTITGTDTSLADRGEVVDGDTTYDYSAATLTTQLTGNITTAANGDTALATSLPSSWDVSGIVVTTKEDDPVTPAIPEPTTGLLLLIGAAGLALRRKA